MLSISDGILDPARDIAHAYDLMTGRHAPSAQPSIDTALRAAHRSAFRSCSRYLSRHLTMRAESFLAPGTSSACSLPECQIASSFADGTMTYVCLRCLRMSARWESSNHTAIRQEGRPASVGHSCSNDRGAGWLTAAVLPGPASAKIAPGRLTMPRTLRDRVLVRGEVYSQCTRRALGEPWLLSRRPGGSGHTCF